MSKLKIQILILIICGAMLFAPCLILASITSDNYQIWADNFSSGGDDLGASDNYNLRDTIGEGAIGDTSADNYSAKVGFRNAVGVSGAETLTLSLGSGSVALGGLSKTEAKTASHTLTVETNSPSGVSIVYTGSTLSCASCAGTVNSISAMGAAGASSNPGTSQFGFNAIYSSGSSPHADSIAPYNAGGTYAFHSGDQIISSSGEISSTVFNVNYLANISGSETAGNYSATVTFTATANF